MEFTAEALSDLESYRKAEQKKLLETIKSQLVHSPHLETRNRKKLRPNRLSERELRVGNLRVFFDVDETARIVRIKAVGHKRGDELILRGEKYEI